MEILKSKAILPAAMTGLLTPLSSVWAGPVLAALPEPGSYISPLRILAVLVMLIPWLAFCQWVDKDTQFIRRVNRQMWNGIVLGGGVVGLVLLLAMPWQTPGLFAAGFGLWLVIAAGTGAVYVVIRNNMVDVSARVFTPRHIKAKLSSIGKKKEQRADVIERVRLSNFDGKKITPPTDPTEMDAYEAAQSLLFDALWRRATEADLLVSPKGVRLIYRIDGVLTQRDDLMERDPADKALLYVKKIAGLDVNERRRPQQGAIRAAIAGSDTRMTDIDVQSSGTTKGERLLMRIVSAEGRMRIAELGPGPKQLEQLEAIASLNKGLVVVAGPRASGVTTTLYACLKSHDAFIQNLLTLERQPLMDLENVTQNVFDAGKHEASYARQLQTVLRREPDVVLVSDCADRETAHLVCKAALDGKKIYVGMQAKDAFDALKKLLSLAGDMDAVADALVAITAQRLIRKLCIACRQAYKPDRALLAKANLPADKIEHFYRPPPDGLFDAKGNPILCTNCQGSGYYGRTGVFEVFEVDDPIRELIRKGQPASAIQPLARKKGMRYLQEVALDKVIEGVTSMNEVLRALRDEEGGAGPPVAAPVAKPKQSE